MAVFNFSPTIPGNLLMADVQNGAVLVPTKFVIGTGYMGTGKQPGDISAVITPLKEFAVSKKTRTPDGYCIFGCVMTNEDVTEAFYLRELALYAKAEYRDSSGNVTRTVPEICLLYGNSGGTADLYPAYSTSTVVERALEISSYVGGAAQVDLTIESGIYALKTDIINPNLLDNWYFGNPVNRKGQTEYQGNQQVSTDRWILEHSTTLTLHDGYETISGMWDKRQIFKTSLPPGVYTMSALCRNVVGSLYLQLFDEDGTQLESKDFSNIGEESEVVKHTVTLEREAKSFKLSLSGTSTGRADLVAAKVELGARQSIAHLDANGNWALNEIPDYAEEYAKCVQYSLTDGSYIGLGANAVAALSIGTDRISIPASADLNNYLTVGNYCCITTIWAESLANSPTMVAFLLNVEAATGENLIADPTKHTYIRQHIRDLHNKEFYRVITTNATGVISYGDWVKIYTSAERPTAAEIGAVPSTYADIHNLTNMGLNGCNIDTQFLFNYVTSVSEDGYGTRPADGWFNVLNIVGGHFVTQIAVTCLANLDVNRPVSMYVRERYVSNDQIWSNWNKVFTSTDRPTVNDIDGLSAALVPASVE